MATAATERHYGLSSNAKHAFDVQDTFLSKASVCANNDAQHAAWHFSVMSSYNTIAFCVYMHVVKTKDIYLSISTSWLYSLDFIMHHGFSKYFTMTLSLQDTKITV